MAERVTTPAQVIWHDLECGSYGADLPLWRALAGEAAGPVLDIGCGTGRVAVDLARRGHEVCGLDHDPVLLAALRERAGGLAVETIEADARDFDLDRRFALCLVPMQTAQILGGPAGRQDLLRCVRRHLEPGAVLAVALADALEGFDADGQRLPPPDTAVHEGVLYSTQPVSVHEDGDAVEVRRLRRTRGPDGAMSAAEDLVRLERLTGEQLAAEAQPLGFAALPLRRIEPTVEHVGSRVVVLRA